MQGDIGLVTQPCPTLETLCTVARQAPPSMGFSRQEYGRGLPFPSPTMEYHTGILKKKKKRRMK